MNSLIRFRKELGIHPRHGVPSPLKTGRSRSFINGVFGRLGFKTGAEIGVAEGLNSADICQQNPGVRLYCIDPWAYYPESYRAHQIGQSLCDKRYAEAKKRLASFNCLLIKKMSMDVLPEIPDASLDFVYIDGNHEFDWVMEDLINWSKKVRVGGIVGGHDFYIFNRAGVIDAVYAYTRAHAISEWYVTRERTPSFYWMKQW